MTRRMRLLQTSTLCSLFLFSACSSDDAAPSDDDAAPSGDSDAALPTSDGSPAGDTYSIEWGPLEIPPGEEDTKCVIKRLDNDGSIRVGQFHNVLGNVSHHLIVYEMTEGEEAPEPFDCEPFVDTLDPTKGAPLMVTQKAEDVLTLPAGVAYTLEPNQLIRLEMHYINATDQPLMAQATSTFTTIAEGDFEHEADFLFVGNPDIDIPAGAEQTLGPTFLPLPAELAGSKFFGITGHTHQWGTSVTVATATTADDEGTEVYAPENFLWDEPETVIHSPAFEVPENGGFRFSCSWNNQSGQDVGFGEGANDEMCFFWAYYYPSKGAKVCFHTDQVGEGLDLCCPGNALCALLEDYLGG